MQMRVVDNALSNVRNQVSAEEWAVRVDLAACYRLVAHFGWDDLVFTHISARVPGTHDFLINPYGFMFEEITASSLVRVDLEGTKTFESPYDINPACSTCTRWKAWRCRRRRRGSCRSRNRRRW